MTVVENGRVLTTSLRWIKVFEHRDGQVTHNLGQERTNTLFEESRAWRYDFQETPLAYYVRKSDAMFDAYNNMLETWSSKHNRLHTDFEIYSTEHDADGGLNPWQYADFDDKDVGFPRDSGPASGVPFRWASLPGTRLYEAHNRRPCHFAFYIARTEFLPRTVVWIKVFEHRDGQVMHNLGKERTNTLFEASRAWRYDFQETPLAYYVRKSDAIFDAYNNMLETWSSKHNRFHTDFEIYSTEHDADRGLNPWQYADFDDKDVGFPRDSGPASGVPFRWASLPGTRLYEAHNRRPCHFAFYVLQAFEESAEGQLLQRMRAIEREHREASATHFNFIVARHVRSCSMTRLPRLQDLSATHPDWIVRMPVDMTSAVLGQYRRNMLAVSHRWETAQEPDSLGAQLAALKHFLEEHPTIEYVWMDFLCMPQGKRTEAEEIEFHEMLCHVNALYLGMRVLILLDISSLSRFWTQMEAWMSMQDHYTVPEPRRFTIVPLHNARDSEAKRLVEMWDGASAQEAHDKLSLPDVTVTNERDKSLHLPKIRKLHDTVAEHLEAHNIIDSALQQLAHAVVAGGDGASCELAMANARTAGVGERSLQEAQALFG